MKTSELPNGSVIKFKTHAKIQLFYEQVNVGWTNQGPAFLSVDPNDIMTIIKTSSKSGHVGQTVFMNGKTRVLHYKVNSFFDMNQGVVAQIDITAGDFYYDVL